MFDRLAGLANDVNTAMNLDRAAASPARDRAGTAGA